MPTPNDKSIVIFGQDITKIPCFRNSFLYGISGGLCCGLTYFMFTSQPRMASHFAMGSYTVITLVYWIQCRYNYSKVKFEMQKVQRLLQEHALYEGTSVEMDLDSQLAESKPVDD